MRTASLGKPKWTVFDIVNFLFMLAVCAATVYPFLYLLSLSLSSPNVPMTVIHLIPPEWSFGNYKKVLANEYIASGFANTVVRTLLGTAMSLFFTICAAYPLAKKQFPHRGFWTAFAVFTMFFSGGLIPVYLLVKKLGIMNSVWALVLPSLISTFSMIIARNYFMSLPIELEESAKIDGAHDWTVLFRIVVPVSAPIIATLALWSAVGHWNAWFDSLIYITDNDKQVLQVVMRRIVLEGTSNMMDFRSDDPLATVNPEMVKAATVMVTVLPIVLTYPFLQKYFIKGVLVGSLKG
jgi:putative aldouronate transport system permease protein